MDDKKLTPGEEALLEKLKEIIKTEKPTAVPVPLDHEETEALRRMIEIYESFKAFGRFAGAARNVVLFLGSLLVGWFVLVDNAGSLWHKLFGGS